MASLALKNFDNQLLSLDEFYDGGGPAVGTHARLAIPAMTKYPPDIANLCLDINGILFRHSSGTRPRKN
jgi:hypothetical protein